MQSHVRAGVALATIVAAVVVAAPAGATGRRAVSVQDAVSTLAGAPVPVECVTVADFNAAAYEAPNQLWAYDVAGLYDFNRKQILLTNAVCNGLATLPTLGSKPISLVAAVAVFTLAHEIGHGLYGPDEVTADQYGLAHASAVAYLLGLGTRANYWMLADWIANYAPLHDGVVP